MDLGSALTNPYVTALGVPLVLIFSGAFAKKLVRGTEWRLSDFFLGVELSLAAMASALVYIFDLERSTTSMTPTTLPATQKMVATASFLAVCFFLLLWILSAHQDWEKRVNNPRGQLIRLALVGNLVGSGLFAAFVLLVKGV
jgi:hypothetical protein